MQAAPNKQYVPQSDLPQTNQQCMFHQSTPQPCKASTSASEGNVISFEDDFYDWLFWRHTSDVVWQFLFLWSKSLSCPVPVEGPVAGSSQSGFEPDAGSAVGKNGDDTSRFAPVKKMSTSKSKFLGPWYCICFWVKGSPCSHCCRAQSRETKTRWWWGFRKWFL